MSGNFEWGGYSFLPLGHHDGRFVRRPGVFAFVRRGPDEARRLLFVDHADYLAGWAGPGHPAWTEALGMGMNELHVLTKAVERIDRLLVRGNVIKRCQPVMNLAAPDQQTDWAARWGAAVG